MSTYGQSAALCRFKAAVIVLEFPFTGSCI